jgi:hypothetical protein
MPDPSGINIVDTLDRKSPGDRLRLSIATVVMVVTMNDSHQLGSRKTEQSAGDACTNACTTYPLTLRRHHLARIGDGRTPPQCTRGLE